MILAVAEVALHLRPTQVELQGNQVYANRIKMIIICIIYNDGWLSNKNLLQIQEHYMPYIMAIYNKEKFISSILCGLHQTKLTSTNCSIEPNAGCVLGYLPTFLLHCFVALVLNFDYHIMSALGPINLKHISRKMIFAILAK